MGTPVDPSPKVAAEPPRRDQRVRPPDLIYGLDERPPLPHLILLGAQHVAVICPYLVFIALITKAAGASSAVASHAVGLGMIAIALATVLQAHRLGPVGSGYLAPPVVSAHSRNPKVRSAPALHLASHSDRVPHLQDRQPRLRRHQIHRIRPPR